MKMVQLYHIEFVMDNTHYILQMMSINSSNIYQKLNHYKTPLFTDNRDVIEISKGVYFVCKSI